jgi:hypothetical protein
MVADGANGDDEQAHTANAGNHNLLVNSNRLNQSRTVIQLEKMLVSASLVCKGR